MSESIRIAGLGRKLKGIFKDRLQSARLGEVLVAQAQRRIENGGDSEHRYPDLWDHPGSFRRGGEPLLTEGFMQGLSGWVDEITEGIKIVLGGTLIHIYHQHGFETKGPNFIPLTLKARRTHRKGQDPKKEGLVPGEDYIMAWGGVKVPQRKVFNLPQEDKAEIIAEVQFALAGG